MKWKGEGRTQTSDFRLQTSHFPRFVLRPTVYAFVAYAVLTIALTWPLLRGLTRDIPADFGDPLLNAWVMAWDADHVARAITGEVGALGNYWHANIYYPHPLSLAYSEHLTAQALLILPLYAITHNPILCYNVVFLLTFVLSAVGMFLFVREQTGSVAGALVAGVAFGFAPYRFSTLPHLQVLSSMWMPFVLLGFHRFLESRRRAPLVGAAAAWIAQNLSCGYYLLFFGPVVALYLVLEIVRRRAWADGRLLLELSVSISIVGLATLPFLLPYWQLRQLGFSPRTLVETKRFAADTLAYFTTDIGMWLWGRTIRAWPQPEGSLFPGFSILALAGAGIVACWQHARRSSPAERTTPFVRGLTALLVVVSGLSIAMLFGWSLRMAVGGVTLRLTNLVRGLASAAVLAAAILAVSRRSRATARGVMASPVGTLMIVTIFAFVMSLGPEMFAWGRPITGTSLYSLFYQYVPGFDGVRVPARYGMIVALGLAALAGHGAAVLVRVRYGLPVLALTAICMVAESWAAPIPLNVNSTEYKQNGLVPLPDTLPALDEIPAVYRFVATLPPESALIELPFGEIAFETRYMFYSTAHWRRLVNGYSGGGPDEYGLWAERFKDFLIRPDAAWQAVVDSRATHLIVHEGSYAADRGQRISEWAAAHGAREVRIFGSDHLFEIR